MTTTERTHPMTTITTITTGTFTPATTELDVSVDGSPLAATRIDGDPRPVMVVWLDRCASALGIDLDPPDPDEAEIMAGNPPPLPPLADLSDHDEPDGWLYEDDDGPTDGEPT